MSSSCSQLPRKLPKRKSRFKRSDGSTSSDTTSSFIKRQVKASTHGGNRCFLQPCLVAVLFVLFKLFSCAPTQMVFFLLLFCLFSWSNTGNLMLGIFILSSESVALLSARGQQTVWERSSAAWKSHHSPVFVINVFRSRLRWRFGCYLRHSLAVQPPLWCLITEFYLQADILL